MRALVIILVVSVFLGLCSSRGPAINNDIRNSRHSPIGPSPLNPFFSPFYNRTSYSLSSTASSSSFLPHQQLYNPHTHQVSAHQSVTVIPNPPPQYGNTQYQQQYAPAPPPYQPTQFQHSQQYQQPQQYQPQQPLFYPQHHQQQQQPIDDQINNFYSTPTPPVYVNPTPLYDVPAQQYNNLIDQGYYKYPVFIDPGLANSFKASSPPMYMKKRTIHDLCAAYAPEEKTVIYVLSQNPSEPPEEIEVPKLPPTKPSKPEVFFVKYNTPEEADVAQKHIQAQYDALGGTSELSNEGISPISSVQEILQGSNNITRSIHLAKHH